MSETLTVLLFAAARDVVREGEVTIPFPADPTAAGALKALCEAYPALAPYARSLRVAVNGEYARAGDPVRPGDEVAVIPPVAGG